MLIDDVREYSGTEARRYELNIELMTLSTVGPRFAHRKPTALWGASAEWYWAKFPHDAREKFSESVEGLQCNPDVWLAHYNTEHPRRGYPSVGR